MCGCESISQVTRIYRTTEAAVRAPLRSRRPARRLAILRRDVDAAL